MSTDAAIAASTATLARMLRGATKGVVQTRPLFRARVETEGHPPYLNLSLYHLAIDPDLRNNPDISRRTGGKTPEGGFVVPLPVNLYYLLTAFPGRDSSDAEILSHRLLGQGMSFLHDHPVLNRAQITSLLAQTPTGEVELPQEVGESGLERQIERLTVTFQPLTDDDINKLWTAAQAGYSPSVAYRVGVVVIDSDLNGSSPLPVLRRGAEDKGVITLPGSPLPELREIKVPAGRGVVFAGETIEVLGNGFASDEGSSVQVRLKPIDPGADVLLDVDAQSSADRLVVLLKPDVVRVGVHSVAVLVKRKMKVLENGVAKDAFQTWSSNELPLGIAPKVVEFVDATNNVIPRPASDFRILNMVGDNLPVRLFCLPTLTATGVNGVAKFADKIELLFDNAGSILPETPVLTNGTTAQFGAPAQGTQPARPLFFQVPLNFDDDLKPSAQKPDRNVRSIRLRVNGVELSKFTEFTAEKPPLFDNFVRITKTP